MKSDRILGLAGALVLLLASAWAGAQAKDEPLRLFWSWGTNQNPQWAAEFKALGFNAITTAAPNTPNWWEKKNAFEPMEALLEAAEKAGVGVYIQIMWSSDMASRIPVHAVTKKGTVENRLACPAAPEYWQYLTISLEAMAKKALEKPAIKGVVNDTEQYQGTETSGAISDIYCFCDRCFTQFLTEQKRPVELPPVNQRAAWLEQNKLTRDYYASLEKQVETLTTALVKRLAEVNPAFEMHYYLADTSWFYRGFLRGLATSGKRVYVLDERSYYGYIPARGVEMEKFLPPLNPNAVWSPGFYANALTPRGLMLNLRKVHREGRPYWLYNQKIPFPAEQMEELKKVRE